MLYLLKTTINSHISLPGIQYMHVNLSMHTFLKITFIILALSFFNSYNCLAQKDPYKHDYNYEYVYTHSGVSSYLDKRTVNVYEYNPPLYVIAGSFARFYNNQEGKILDPVFVEIQFNYKKRETFTRRNGVWEKDVTTPNTSVGESNRAFANALFRAAYGMDFYD